MRRAPAQRGRSRRWPQPTRTCPTKRTPQPGFSVSPLLSLLSEERSDRGARRRAVPARRTSLARILADADQVFLAGLVCGQTPTATEAKVEAMYGPAQRPALLFR